MYIIKIRAKLHDYSLIISHIQILSTLVKCFGKIKYWLPSFVFRTNCNSWEWHLWMSLTYIVYLHFLNTFSIKWHTCHTGVVFSAKLTITGLESHLCHTFIINIPHIERLAMKTIIHHNLLNIYNWQLILIMPCFMYQHISAFLWHMVY